MFVDVAKIFVKAGDGGNGAVAFHREKYIAAGGPDGGDGGNGGDIVFKVDNSTDTLLAFKYKKKYVAQNGENGSSKKSSGKSAPPLIIRVPKGTIIRDFETDKVIHDMSDGKDFTLFKGGNGGWGNYHFATPTRQCPRFAKNGLPGESRMLKLELKLLADVGLIGFPNVGKSTFLSMVSAARPKIANYHFTTLAPQLGVVSVYDKSFVMADIPGLIEGASEGQGLGLEFLRHVDRCRILIHVVDIAGTEGRDAKEDYDKINAELSNYSAKLSTLPQIVCGNKIDAGIDEEYVEEFRKYVEKDGRRLFLISAASNMGLDAVVAEAYKYLSEAPEQTYYEAEINLEAEREEKKNDRSVQISFEEGIYYVTGDWMMSIIGNVDPNDFESLRFMNNVLKDKGVYDALENAGCNEGDTVDIYGWQFEYYR